MSDHLRIALRAEIDYDPLTGTAVWRAKPGKQIGSIGSAGYRIIYLRGRKHRLHRLIWLYVFGEFPREFIDHINGDRDDNRLCNLRDVSLRINTQNQIRARDDNACGVLGVSRRGDRWRAQIKLIDKKVHLGTFDTAEAAHAAYVEAKRKHHEGCTL